MKTISKMWQGFYAELGEVEPEAPLKNTVILKTMTPSKYETFAEIVVEKLKPQNSILEIGCGYGGLCSEILKRVSISYTVIDNEKMLKQAKKFLGEEIEYIDATEIDSILNRKFDLLISNFCLTETPLEYLEYVLKNIIKNCQQILITDSEDELLEKYLKEYFTITKTVHGTKAQFMYVGIIK